MNLGIPYYILTLVNLEAKTNRVATKNNNGFIAVYEKPIFLYPKLILKPDHSL